MRNTSIKAYRYLGFGLLTALVAAVTVTAIMSYLYQDASPQSRLLSFALHHHLGIMVILMLVSVVYGFVWASFTMVELERRQQDSRSMLDIVLLFLAPEERQLLNYLVAQGGSASQADVARLPGFGRVKAHRLVKRMEQKNLVDVEVHGKARRLALKANILNALLE